MTRMQTGARRSVSASLALWHVKVCRVEWWARQSWYDRQSTGASWCQRTSATDTTAAAAAAAADVGEWQQDVIRWSTLSSRTTPSRPPASVQTPQSLARCQERGKQTHSTFISVPCTLQWPACSSWHLMSACHIRDKLTQNNLSIVQSVTYFMLVPYIWEFVFGSLNVWFQRSIGITSTDTENSWFNSI